MNKKRAGLTIIVLAMVLIAVWEFWGREALAYDKVLALREDAAENKVIEAEDFVVIKMENAPDWALRADAAESLTGMKTAQYVAGRTPLRKEYFAPSLFYIGADSERAIMALPLDWLLSCPQTVRRGDAVGIYGGDGTIMEAVVIHAKNSGGQEVVSADAERLNGTEAVSFLEIIGDKDDLIRLAESAASGEKFALLCLR